MMLALLWGVRAHAQSVQAGPLTSDAERPLEVLDRGVETTGGDASASPVTPPTTPTQVRAAVTLLALNRISAANEPFPSFDATLMLTARWVDPRLAFDATAEGDERRIYLGQEVNSELRKMWSPGLTIVNEEGEPTVDARTLIVRADGTVTHEETFHSRFRVEFDLRAFPFDTQALRFVVQSMTWNARFVELAPIEARIAIENEQTVQDWTLGEVLTTITESQETRSSRPFSCLTVSIHARRDPGFYLGKVMLPLLLIVAFTWTTFWMTGEAAATRMQRGFIALLSIVAFTQVITQHLPRISQITFLDAVMYLAFTSTGLTLLQIVATHRADQRGQKDLAVRYDHIARIVFPLGFAVAIIALLATYSAF